MNENYEDNVIELEEVRTDNEVAEKTTQENNGGLMFAIGAVAAIAAYKAGEKAINAIKNYRAKKKLKEAELAAEQAMDDLLMDEDDDVVELKEVK